MLSNHINAPEGEEALREDQACRAREKTMPPTIAAATIDVRSETLLLLVWR